MALYVVATPIGNLEDITLRALRVLKEASLIAAEDTRETRKLLTHYGITTPLTSYHEHNERNKAPLLVEKLKHGEEIALVSDAGTPGISDPGFRLVRLAVEESIPVITVPGPSAVAAAMSVAGLPTDEFTFKGFVPSRASQRKKFFLGLRGEAHTYVMYESPRRLLSTLECIRDVLGNAEVAVARELTKLHEEVLRGKAAEVAERLSGTVPRGEITIVVRTTRDESAVASPEEEIELLLKEGLSIKEAAAAVSATFGIKRQVAYRMALKVKDGMKS